MKSNNFRILIATVVTVGAFLGIYFGAFLPLRKSQMYVNTQINLSNIHTLNEFDSMFDNALGYYSPVGQDETVQGYLGVLMNVLQQNPAPDSATVLDLAKHAEKWGQPIIDRGASFNYGQITYSLGAVYKLTTVKLNSMEYYQKTVAVFEDGLKHSPNRTVFLYNLLDLYIAVRDKANAQRIGDIIIKYWPENKNQIDQALSFIK